MVISTNAVLETIMVTLQDGQRLRALIDHGSQESMIQAQCLQNSSIEVLNAPPVSINGVNSAAASMTMDKRVDLHLHNEQGTYCVTITPLVTELLNGSLVQPSMPSKVLRKLEAGPWSDRGSIKSRPNQVQFQLLIGNAHANAISTVVAYRFTPELVIKE